MIPRACYRLHWQVLGKATADQETEKTKSPLRVNLIKLAFLKALTFMKDFTDNTEFNKYCSQLVATPE